MLDQAFDFAARSADQFQRFSGVFSDGGGSSFEFYWGSGEVDGGTGDFD